MPLCSCWLLSYLSKSFPSSTGEVSGAITKQLLAFWMSYHPHCCVGPADGKYNKDQLYFINPSAWSSHSVLDQRIGKFMYILIDINFCEITTNEWTPKLNKVEDRTCTCTSGSIGRRPTNRTYVMLLNPITQHNPFNRLQQMLEIKHWGKGLSPLRLTLNNVRDHHSTTYIYYRYHR